MDDVHCARCGRDLGPGRAGTFYCEQCLRTAARVGSSGLWWATLTVLAIMIAAGAFLAVFAPALTNVLGGTGRLVVGLVWAIVPAFLWLALFYSEDRLEPEPTSYVVSVFILGALLGGAVEQPLLREVFQVQRWVQPGSLSHLLTAILLNGILTSVLIYVAVRFSVMPTAEFNERVDGIIYATAAALGLGVAANLNYLLQSGTLSLGVGTLHLIINSLAYATFGAVIGYFLGLIRPGGGPGWLAPIGVLVAGTLNGLYEWINAQLGSTELSYSPWPSLIASAIFAGLVFGLSFYLLRRAYQAMVLLPSERTS